MTPASRTATTARLAALREELGAIDAELVALLSRRLAVARCIGVEKRAAGLATLDPGREAKVVANAARLAREAGIPEEPVRDIFWPVLAMCRAAQQDDA